MVRDKSSPRQDSSEYRETWLHYNNYVRMESLIRSDFGPKLILPHQAFRLHGCHVGGDVSYKNSFGRTALMKAVIVGHNLIMKFLLDQQGVKINADPTKVSQLDCWRTIQKGQGCSCCTWARTWPTIDKDGYTALIWAVRSCIIKGGSSGRACQTWKCQPGSGRRIIKADTCVRGFLWRTESRKGQRNCIYSSCRITWGSFGICLKVCQFEKHPKFPCCFFALAD